MVAAPMEKTAPPAADAKWRRAAAKLAKWNAPRFSRSSALTKTTMSSWPSCGANRKMSLPALPLGLSSQSPPNSVSAPDPPKSLSASAPPFQAISAVASDLPVTGWGTMKAVVECGADRDIGIFASVHCNGVLARVSGLCLDHRVAAMRPVCRKRPSTSALRVMAVIRPSGLPAGLNS